MKLTTMIMKPTSITTLLSLSVALALLHCGCITDTGAGAGSNNAAQADVAATTALQNLYASVRPPRPSAAKPRLSSSSPTS